MPGLTSGGESHRDVDVRVLRSRPRCGTRREFVDAHQGNGRDECGERTEIIGGQRSVGPDDEPIAVQQTRGCWKVRIDSPAHRDVRNGDPNHLWRGEIVAARQERLAGDRVDEHGRVRQDRRETGRGKVAVRGVDRTSREGVPRRAPAVPSRSNARACTCSSPSGMGGTCEAAPGPPRLHPLERTSGMPPCRGEARRSCR